MNASAPPCCFGPQARVAGRIGLVSIDDGCAVPMICFVRADGDVTIATGPKTSLVDEMAGHPIVIEFDTCGAHGCSPWTVSSADRAIRVVTVDYHGWYLRPDVLPAAVSGRTAARVRIPTLSLAPQSVRAS